MHINCRASSSCEALSTSITQSSRTYRDASAEMIAHQASPCEWVELEDDIDAMVSLIFFVCICIPCMCMMQFFWYLREFL